MGFDPARSATAWVRGIAARLLSSRRRVGVRARRRVPPTALGEEARADAPSRLCTGPADAEVAGGLQEVAFEGGFELRSRWKMDDRLPSKWPLDTEFNKPPVLTVGLRGKPEALTRQPAAVDPAGVGETGADRDGD